MTDDMPSVLPSRLLSRLKVPHQDLDRLSFCPSKPSGVAQWVQTLPMTRISYVSSLLYKALPEIGRLKGATATARLEMLEQLHPAVQQIIDGLTPQFLNQSLILPEAARKAATVAQALQKHLSNAYLVTLSDLDQASPSDPLQEQRALTLYRALDGLGRLLLRSYQLYTPVPRRLWLELHTVYRLAEYWQVCHLAPNAVEPPIRTVQEAYQRLLLLACGRPNQLRQTEVSQVYEALGELAPLVRMMDYQKDQQDNLFAIMLDSDNAPLYKSRLPETPGDTLRELDTGPAVAAVDEARAALGAQAAGSRDRFGLNGSLNEHLSRAWRLLAQRSFQRQPGKGALTITIGLLNLHFHLADGRPFKLFLNQTAQVDEAERDPLFGEPKQPFAAPEADDPWGQAFDAGGNRLAGDELVTFNIEQDIRDREQQSYRGEHPTHQVPLVDTSPGGYSVEWPHPVPPQLKAGEVLGMKEQGGHTWSVGVVRWVQRGRTSTVLGIQTLSPRATPLAAAVIYKTGDTSEFLRALELPGLKAVNQPPTLITNALTFHEYCKVQLYWRNSGQREDNHRTQKRVQLTRRRFATGAISQFEYRELLNNPAAN